MRNFVDLFPIDREVVLLDGHVYCSMIWTEIY
jgi:hypothetical protein